jgi:exodeoxyribonuclease VII small subunit
MAKRNLTPPKSFEDALRELETILAEIEGGELGLEDSLAKYERGTFLIQHCRGVLGAAEKQIELLSKSPDGGLQSEPMALPGARQPTTGEPETGAESGAVEERGID